MDLRILHGLRVRSGMTVPVQSGICIESPDVAEPVLNIHGQWTGRQELYTIKYTMCGPDRDLHGGYIEHGVTEDTVF